MKGGERQRQEDLGYLLEELGEERGTRRMKERCQNQVHSSCFHVGRETGTLSVIHAGLSLEESNYPT